MTTRWAQVGRGWAAAVTAIVVAAASHLLAGGAAPTPFALGVALVIAGMICTVLAGKAVSVWRLSLGIGASQFLLHAVFAGLGSPNTAAHEHGVSGVIGFTASEHGTMWAAHAIAAAVTILLFRNAETAFWGLATTGRMLLRRILTAAAPVRLTPIPTPAPPVWSYRPVALAVDVSHLRHRGPPVTIAAH